MYKIRYKKSIHMDTQTRMSVQRRILCMLWTMFHLPFSMWLTMRLHNYQQQILTVSEINTFLLSYFSKCFHDNLPYVLAQELMLECNICSSIWNWWSHITLSSHTVGHWHGRHTGRDREPDFYLTMLSIARIMSVEHWWNDSDRKTEVLREPIPVPLCPP